MSRAPAGDRKSTRLNSSHGSISYAVFCLKKKKSIRVERVFYKNDREEMLPSRTLHLISNVRIKNDTGSEIEVDYNFLFYLFFFNDTATTEIYTLSLHDALPISRTGCGIDSSTAFMSSMTFSPHS